MDTELLPVSICFKLSPLPESHFVADCLSIIRAHKLLPFAVHSDNQSFIDLCHQLGLADLPEKPFKAKPQRTTVKQRPLVVTKPVRSGQQVYAQNRDLVVMAPVSNGAEVMADGSIYLYDTLRGRAMAGVKGDSSASIVCKKLEAELIAIAGIYMLNEQFSQHAQEIIAYIDDDTLIVDTIKD